MKMKFTTQRKLGLKQWFFFKRKDDVIVYNGLELVKPQIFQKEIFFQKKSKKG